MAPADATSTHRGYNRLTVRAAALVVLFAELHRSNAFQLCATSNAAALLIKRKTAHSMASIRVDGRRHIPSTK